MINPVEKAKSKYWINCDLILLVPGSGEKSAEAGLALPISAPVPASRLSVQRCERKTQAVMGMGEKDGAPSPFSSCHSLEPDAVKDHLVRAMEAWHKGKCFYAHEERGVSLTERVEELRALIKQERKSMTEEARRELGETLRVVREIAESPLFTAAARSGDAGSSADSITLRPEDANSLKPKNSKLRRGPSGASATSAGVPKGNVRSSPSRRRGEKSGLLPKDM